MDAATFTALLLTCAPLVHPDTARALIAVESSFNPHAIGVVGGQLLRQPGNAAEASATAAQLAKTGWNFSVGLGQINRHNFERLGLTVESAFAPCDNLRAMQTVLLECHSRVPAGAGPQSSLRQALSCYYSGNFTTGFRQGYVRRIASAAEPRVPTRVGAQ